MQQIKSEQSLKEYQEKMAHNRRIVVMAQTILKRAKDAGIPEKYMRINKDKFKNVLDDRYHKNVDKIANFVYDTPLNLLKKEFILIDGGTMHQRKIAGFGLLFRLISCDRYGTYKNGVELSHQLQTIKAFGEGLYRNDITESMRSADILFISECGKSEFKKGFEVGRFFDDFLSYRDDYVKPTIISFSQPIPSGKGMGLQDNNEMVEQDQFGQYMCMFSKSETNKDDRIFRIRVKSNG